MYFAAAAFVMFVLLYVATYLDSASKKKLERQQRKKVEQERQQEIIDSTARLEAERQLLKGTGKQPFLDWEISFLESHTIRFRRRSPPRAKPSGWTTEWDETQLLKQESCCFWCGLSLEGVAHRDHVQPLARGGLNHVSNLVWACPPCNLDKSASEPKSWIRNTTRISEERKLMLERILVIPLSTEDTYNFISDLDPGFDPDTEDPDQLVEFDVIQLSLFNEKIVE